VLLHPTTLARRFEKRGALEDDDRLLAVVEVRREVCARVKLRDPGQKLGCPSLDGDEVPRANPSAPLDRNLIETWKNEAGAHLITLTWSA